MLHSNLTKYLLLFSSSVALSYTVLSAYRYWRRKQLKSLDEGFEETSRIEENLVKRVLVLGLENAGKSTILAQMSNLDLAGRVIKPMEGFNVTSLHCNGTSLNIWEIGGAEKLRAFWPNFLQDTDVLVFVVDSADLRSLAIAVKELRTLLADPRLYNVPLLLLAHKQDVEGALSADQVRDAFEPYEAHCVGTQRGDASIDIARDTLLRLCGCQDAVATSLDQ